MPKLFRARLTDCGRMRAEDVKPKPIVKLVHVTPVAKPGIRDAMARTTRICTFYGPYTANREGGNLNVYCEGEEGDVSGRTMVSCFWGKAFVAEIEGDELSILLMSDEQVSTSVLGDRVDTKMNAALFQKRIIGKVRRLADRGLR